MSDASYHLGIDLGGTTIKFALLNQDGEVDGNNRILTDADQGPDDVIQRMIAGAQEMIAAKPAGAPVRSIGVAAPGLVDMDLGVSKFMTNLPGHWPGVPISPPIEEATGIKTFLINDVRAFTAAELALGSARGLTTAICYAVGTGIGGGIVAHGQVNMGIGGAGGELGHAIVDPGGPRCNCGNRGCVEAYAAGPAIIGDANRRIVQGAATALREMVGEDLNKMTPEIVEQAAAEGDEVAKDILDYAGFYFGLGIAGAIASLAPEVVIIGGGVVKPYGYYWQVTEKTARDHCHVTEIDRVEFRPASLGYEAGVVGAAMWGKTQVERQFSH